jgi:hypothetical protein
MRNWPLLFVALFLVSPGLAWTQPTVDLVQNIQQVTLREGRKKSPTWFIPRGCMVPSVQGPVAFMTLQTIAGSDHYGPVQWMQSRDLGKTWTEPQPVPGLGRHKLENGIEQGVCDVVPEYHPTTGTILAMGHTVFYKTSGFFKEQPPRHTVYVVRDAQGNWSDTRKLVWDDPRATYIYTAGCAQRINLENGDVLVPLSFGPDAKKPRSVGTVLCSFDGKELKIKQVSNELKGTVGRGFLEPSLARLDNKFYLTIRAEDGHGYVTTSEEGLNWAKPTAWQWDDGQAIAMSTTQQRWLVHSDALYLVYTRKAPENSSVFRWRAPLYLAQVDRKTLHLIRATERVAVPLVGDGTKEGKNIANLGNFHTQMVTPNESWVTLGEVIPANYRGDLLLARIFWKQPNQLVGNK